MKNNTNKTPITYYGGKQKMTKHILPLIPEHTLYCEPFVGGGAVFWLKQPSEVEVINDLNGNVANFYTVCQQDYGMLRLLVQSTPHSRKIHREAGTILQYPDVHSTVKRAWAFWVQTNMGFAGMIGKGWAYEKKTGKTSLKIYNKKRTFGKWCKDRLNLVQIECNDALRVIESRDTPESFFYIDPPYFNSDCGHYKGYTKDDFRKLLELLSRIKGKFLLSSYPSDILNEFTKAHGWKQKQYQSAIAVTQHTTKLKIEVLTANYNI